MFQSLKGIHVVCDADRESVEFAATAKFQSLKGIHVVCDHSALLLASTLNVFQSLKGIHVVCDATRVHPEVLPLVRFNP